MILDKLKDLEKEALFEGIPIVKKDKAKKILEIIKEKNPKRVLEIGSGNGYSGLILTSFGAKLVTIEKDGELVEIAKKNFKKYNVNVKVIFGYGVEEIKKLNEKFDLIFIDFSKRNYIKVLDDCYRLLENKGIIIADNVNMELTKDFKTTLLNDKRLETKIIEIGDGLSYSVKI